MKFKLTLIIFSIVASFKHTCAQPIFEVRHTSPNFGFDWPIQGVKNLDTLGMILYSAESNDSTLFVGQMVHNDSNFISLITSAHSITDSDSVATPNYDKAANLLQIHQIMYSNIFDSINEIYAGTIEQEDTSIQCAELAFSFFHRNEPEKIFYTKVFLRENDLFTFLLIGLKRKESELNLLKESFFNSISLN